MLYSAIHVGSHWKIQDLHSTYPTQKKQTAQNNSLSCSVNSHAESNAMFSEY